MHHHHDSTECRHQVSAATKGRLLRELGKGSHGTLYLGNRYTIMKDHKKEIGPGLLKKMLTDLGLDKSDFE